MNAQIAILTNFWIPAYKAIRNCFINWYLSIENEIILKITDHHDKSVSQVSLRWHYQLGAISIPKSASPARQLENISISISH